MQDRLPLCLWLPIPLLLPFRYLATRWVRWGQVISPSQGWNCGLLNTGMNSRFPNCYKPSMMSFVTSDKSWFIPWISNAEVRKRCQHNSISWGRARSGNNSLETRQIFRQSLASQVTSQIAGPEINVTFRYNPKKVRRAWGICQVIIRSDFKLVFKKHLEAN
jgi:hypothetical protein